MRHQKVKILSFFLAVFIAVASFPALKSNAATVASGSCGTNVTWTLDESNKLTIQGTGDMATYSVASQQPWANYRGKITSVVVTGNVTSIGDRAFYGFSALTSVTLSNKIKTIGCNAFQRCTKLVSITIPSGVTKIDRQAFSSCSLLTTVSMPDTVTTIGNNAFESCSKLKNINLSNNLNSIGDETFKNCSALTSITIPNSLTTLSAGLFSKCTSLTTVNLPANLLKIGGSAFAGCKVLSSITLPSGILYIGETAFDHCVLLTSLTIPASVQTFGYDALGYTGITKVTYMGTLSQWQNIDTLYEDDWTMDDEMAKYNIEVIFANGTNELTITTHPSDFTGKVGTTATFSVKASGDGLTYQWKELINNVWVVCDYSGYNTATLNVPITCDKDGRKYDCTVTDKNGDQRTSYSGTLTIDRVPLKTNTQPVNFAGPVGETATFSVVAQGDELAYQWQVNKTGTWEDSIIPEANTSKITIGITNARSGYKFRCIVTDGYGNSVTSSAATLTALPPISITSQPKDYSGMAGDKATFTVVATGTNLTYQWQTNKNGTWADSSLTGAKTSSLSIDLTAARNGYKFRCIIKDSKGNTLTSNVATLTVTQGVAITKDPENAAGPVNGKATFKVVASGEGLKYQWQVNKGNGWADSSMTGSKTDTLSVDITAARNGYKFRCVVKSSNGAVTLTSKEATLTVVQSLSITKEPANFSGAAGSRALFTVAADGNGLKYQWQVNKGNGWANSSMTGSKTDTLTVDITAARNGYKFRCVVTDSTGNTVTSKDATLTVSASLTITQDPENFTGTVGSVAKYTVVASGDGLKYQWQVNKGNGWTDSSMTGSKTATLSVDITAARNGYSFRCVVKDSLGNTATSREAYLKVVEAPRSSDFKNEIDLGEVVQPSNASATEDAVEFEPSEANDVVIPDVVYISESVVTDIDTAVSESDIASEVS